MSSQTNPQPEANKPDTKADEKLSAALSLIYGAQVAGEFELISETLCRLAAEKGVELTEADLDDFCRQRQAKLTLHAQQEPTEHFERVRLLNMLYEGCLSFLADAAAAFDADAIEAATDKLRRSSKIIAYFAETLNHKVSGDISSKLLKLYDFAARHLEEANQSKSAEKVRAVHRIIKTIYSAYLEIELRQDIDQLLAGRNVRGNSKPVSADRLV